MHSYSYTLDSFQTVEEQYSNIFLESASPVPSGSEEEGWWDVGGGGWDAGCGGRGGGRCWNLFPPRWPFRRIWMRLYISFLLSIRIHNTFDRGNNPLIFNNVSLQGLSHENILNLNREVKTYFEFVCNFETITKHICVCKTDGQIGFFDEQNRGSINIVTHAL